MTRRAIARIGAITAAAATAVLVAESATWHAQAPRPQPRDAAGTPSAVGPHAAVTTRAERRASRSRPTATTPRRVTLQPAKAKAKPERRRTPSARSTWDRLATCESGGRWNQSGPRYYGGLQFSTSTWLSNGGGRYAPRADLAARVEQIAIAKKLYDRRGWAPWPVCGSDLPPLS